MNDERKLIAALVAAAMAVIEYDHAYGYSADDLGFKLLSALENALVPLTGQVLLMTIGGTNP